MTVSESTPLGTTMSEFFNRLARPHQWPDAAAMAATPATTPNEQGRRLDTGRDYTADGTTWIADDTGWITLGLGSGWSHAASYPLQYRRKKGTVMFRGAAASTGATNNIATLPAGFRPGAAGGTRRYPLVSDAASPTRVFIYENGIIQQAATASGTGFGLDVIRFEVD